MILKTKPTRAPLYLSLLFHSPAVDVGGIAEACLRFTPDLTVRRGERPAVFLEVSCCLSLYRVDSLLARIRILLAEWGIRESEYRVGQASSLPRAWLCAVEGISESLIDQAPMSGVLALLDPLGLAGENIRKTQIMIEVLFTLGIRRIGGVRKLPADSAVTRFGELYTRLLEQVGTGDGEFFSEAESFPWERFRPSEKVLERTDLDPDESVWDLEPALFHLKSLIDRTLKRAFGRGQALVALEFRIECEQRRNRREVFTRVPVRFTFPQTEAGIILRTFREKLAYEFGRRELDAPMAAFELEATELAPRRALQGDFLDREQSMEGFRELVSELGTKLRLGKEVFQAELAPVWRPERSWLRTMKDPGAVAGLALPIPERPLTLLVVPEPLRRLGRYFFHQDRRYAIEKFTQIERLSGEWWDSSGGFARTYYRVHVRAVGETEERREFWIFREQRTPSGGGGLFLHGIY